MLREFRDFLIRGNVLALAIAVIVGAAFTSVVNSLVADIITPVLSLLGVPDFSTWTIVLTGVGGSTATFAVGNFLNTVIAAILVAAVIFFGVVKPLAALEARRTAAQPPAPAGPTEIELLTEIRDALRAK